jgi:[acyl-carrier-protein] S-malonyltransferase
MVLAFTFPGQGSQAVGMGKALSEASATARLVFEEVDEALRQNLTKLMFEGPPDELQLTENTQPALMAVSLAIVRTLEKEAGFSIAERVGFLAGHSLGEYSALAAAGALSIDDTARLLKRGRHGRASRSQSSRSGRGRQRGGRRRGLYLRE